MKGIPVVSSDLEHVDRGKSNSHVLLLLFFDLYVSSFVCHMRGESHS